MATAKPMTLRFQVILEDQSLDKLKRYSLLNDKLKEISNGEYIKWEDVKRNIKIHQILTEEISKSNLNKRSRHGIKRD